MGTGDYSSVLLHVIGLPSGSFFAEVGFVFSVGGTLSRVPNFLNVCYMIRQIL